MSISKLVARQSFILIVAVLLLGTFSPTFAAKPDLKESSSSTSLILVFTDAYYADLDGDGIEDDVFGGIDFFITGVSRVTFDYHINLILPSGLTFTYSYRIHTKYTYLHFDNFFFDHAIESGDYMFDVDIIMRTGGVTHSEYSIIFDPPGSVPTDTSFSLTYNGY